MFVRDHGSGIAAEVLEHIFEPMFTTKRAGDTGLGLAVVRQITSEHGGPAGGRRYGPLRQPHPERECHCLAPRVHLQLLEHVLDVVAGGEGGDA